LRPRGELVDALHRVVGLHGGVDAVHPADIATAEHLGARVTHHAEIHAVGKKVLADR
jgi:hypothetical protein